MRARAEASKGAFLQRLATRRGRKMSRRDATANGSSLLHAKYTYNLWATVTQEVNRCDFFAPVCRKRGGLGRRRNQQNQRPAAAATRCKVEREVTQAKMLLCSCLLRSGLKAVKKKKKNEAPLTAA